MLCCVFCNAGMYLSRAESTYIIVRCLNDSIIYATHFALPVLLPYHKLPVQTRYRSSLSRNTEKSRNGTRLFFTCVFHSSRTTSESARPSNTN